MFFYFGIGCWPTFGSSNLLIIYHTPGNKSEALQIGVHSILLRFIMISLNMISSLKSKIKRNFEKIIRERYVIESTAGTIIWKVPELWYKNLWLLSENRSFIFWNNRISIGILVFRNYVQVNAEGWFALQLEQDLQYWMFQWSRFFFPMRNELNTENGTTRPIDRGVFFRF